MNLPEEGNRSWFKSHAPISSNFGLKVVFWVKIGVDKYQGNFSPVGEAYINYIIYRMPEVETSQWTRVLSIRQYGCCLVCWDDPSGL